MNGKAGGYKVILAKANFPSSKTSVILIKGCQSPQQSCLCCYGLVLFFVFVRVLWVCNEQIRTINVLTRGSVGNNETRVEEQMTKYESVSPLPSRCGCTTSSLSPFPHGNKRSLYHHLTHFQWQLRSLTFHVIPAERF